jgi:hypothetical protein
VQVVASMRKFPRGTHESRKTRCDGTLPLTSSAIPAIPPFRPRAGSSRNTPAAPTDADEMDEDPIEYADEPLDEPDALAFETADKPLDDAEAESSYKELLDWMCYLAQHKEQRGRLLDLFTAAIASLRDLPGSGEPEKPAVPATYASVIASAMPKPRPSKKGKSAPSTKHIQHAITRFERVSKELPGAPRDTILKVVSNSNLNTAPDPLPETPQPRKKPACLVKGIRANTLALRLPVSARVPSSIPAVINDVNALLKKDEHECRVREILIGLRRHITIIFDRAVEGAPVTLTLDSVLGKFNTRKEDVHRLERVTTSILKFTAVPTVTNDGRQVTEDLAYSFLRKHPEWKDVQITEKPRFIRPKHNPDPLCATFQVKVEDTQKATVAKKLLSTSVTFAGITRRCQPWTVAPTARQCSTCLKWGHSAYVCHARSPQCDQCAGPHLTGLHRQHASTCEDQGCTHFGIVCANCHEQHNASSVDCSFFKARSSPGQLQKLQKARVERLRRRN